MSALGLSRGSHVDAELCREHLARLLSEESRLLEQLQALLDEELQYLNGSDIDALEKAGAARQTCVGELVRIEEERRSLCRMTGRNSDLQGLEDLLKWCDPQGTLRSHFTRCAEHAARCRDRNDRNGMIVTTRLKRVESMLNVITGRTAQPQTYGPQGGYAPSTGRMIRSAV